MPRTTHVELRRILSAMKQRCYNEKSPEFRWYGAKGATICDEWLSSTDAFIDWALRSSYAASLYLDRIDHNKPYSPNNCRWVDAAQSTRNRTNTLRISYEGRSLTLVEWAAHFGLTYKTLYQRLQKGEEPPNIFRPREKSRRTPTPKKCRFSGN